MVEAGGSYIINNTINTFLRDGSWSDLLNGKQNKTNTSVNQFIHKMILRGLFSEKTSSSKYAEEKFGHQADNKLPKCSSQNPRHFMKTYIPAAQIRAGHLGAKGLLPTLGKEVWLTHTHTHTVSHILKTNS